jgi:hypothetical protein
MSFHSRAWSELVPVSTLPPSQTSTQDPYAREAGTLRSSGKTCARKETVDLMTHLPPSVGKSLPGSPFGLRNTFRQRERDALDSHAVFCPSDMSPSSHRSPGQLRSGARTPFAFKFPSSPCSIQRPTIYTKAGRDLVHLPSSNTVAIAKSYTIFHGLSLV